MDVILAEKAGSCYGVNRALEMAENLISTGEAANTLGPIIHNPVVVADLAQRGLKAVSSVDALTNQTVVIRSHGVTPEVRDALDAKGVRIVDATCPHVMRAQVAARELAQTYGAVVVVGEVGHPEVEGLRAYALREGAHVFSVSSSDELPESLPQEVGVVVQTTQPVETYEKVIAALESRGIAVHPVNTVCMATRQRQRAAASLAATVDAMIVVGGKNSSNTTRLFEICQEHCANTHHIETPIEINPAWFKGCARVGVAAGASTPSYQIDDTLEALQKVEA